MTTSLLTQRFTKIKDDGKQVQLIYLEARGTAEVEVRLTSKERPRPAFTHALAAFAPLAIDLLEVRWSASELAVTGLSINKEEGDGRDGMVLTCRKRCALAKSPLILNTPHLREPVKPEERDQAGFMPGPWLLALRHAREEAQRFVDGARAQAELFDGDDDRAGPDAGDTITISAPGHQPVTLPAKELTRRIRSVVSLHEPPRRGKKR